MSVPAATPACVEEPSPRSDMGAGVMGSASSLSQTLSKACALCSETAQLLEAAVPEDVTGAAGSLLDAWSSWVWASERLREVLVVTEALALVTRGEQGA